LKDSDGDTQYFVHYIGWNSRHDGWISGDAIVGLASATPARHGRTPKSLSKVVKLIEFISGEFKLCSIILSLSIHWNAVLHTCRLCSLCRAMLCIVATLLCRHEVSVCVSVTFVDSVKTNKHIYKISTPSGSQAILVIPHQRAYQYCDWNPPNRGIECRLGVQKSLL